MKSLLVIGRIIAVSTIFCVGKMSVGQTFLSQKVQNQEMFSWMKTMWLTDIWSKAAC
jgi:hypothetical protein